GEVLGLTPSAESELLELGEHERREMVVDERGLNVVGLESRVAPELFGHHTHLRQTGDVLAVVAGHHLAVEGGALGGGGNDRGGLLEVAGAFGAGDDQRDTAVALLAAIQQPQNGFDDPPRILVIFQCYRTLVEPRVGVGGGVVPVDDGDPAEVLVGHPIGRHVALRVQRDPRRGGEQSERRVMRHEQRGLGAGASAAAEAHPGAFVEGAVADHHIGDARRHRHRRMRDGACRRPAAVRNPGEERQIADADVAGHLDLVAGIHRERDHAVDVARRQARVIECGADRLARQLQLTAAGFLGELGLTDTGDGGVPGQQRRTHARVPSSRLRTAVPETWLPRLLAAWNATSTKFSPSVPSVLPVTLPVKCSGSSGKHGTPRRIANLVTIASGPAQSVRNRTQYPFEVRMFMNRLGEPCCLAYATSWCTGMKSRDAMAPATIIVVVTGISIGVTSSPTLMSAHLNVEVRDLAVVMAVLP